MGEALVSGLIAAGWEPREVTLCVRRMERGDELAHRTGCPVVLDPLEAIKGRDVIVIGVKPIDVPDLLKRLAGEVKEDQMVVSLAAGVTTQTYEAQLGAVPVVRAMPNTPALVKEGATGLAPGSRAGAAHLDVAKKVLGAVGLVRVMDEELLDALTAVSGTGPAYVFLLAEALTCGKGYHAMWRRTSSIRPSGVRVISSRAPRRVRHGFAMRSLPRVAPPPRPCMFSRRRVSGPS